MTREIAISTCAKKELVNVTSEIEKAVRNSGIEEGTCYVFVPHTTAGIIINEGADPSVKRDILSQLDKIAPSRGSYEHLEGNSPAHIKASIVGTCETIIVENGKLLLGTWQSLYLCEFDGPRHRRILVRIT